MRSERALVQGGLVVTMDENLRVVHDGAVLVEGDRIVAVDKADRLKSEAKADSIIDARDCFVLPGLICGHTHLYGIALRGSGMRVEPPSDFLQILQRVWWPLDERLENDAAYASALAACMEMALTGTTCFADTYSAPNGIDGSLDAIARAVNEVGLRGMISFEATERRSREEGVRGLRENERFLSVSPVGRVMGMVSIHASFTVTDDLVGKGVEIAERFGCPITIHVSEGPNDVYHNIERYGMRTVERLERLGLLSPRAVLAHCVHLTSREISIIARTGASVAHNPMSNMLNAVGVAPVPEMLRSGVNVCLGNDGYVFDAFENIRAAFLVHKVHRRDPTIISAREVLEMATNRAARSYGLKDLGSLAAGKLADVVVVRPRVMAAPYSGDPYSYVINGLRGSDVKAVMVGGELIVREGRLLKVDQREAESRVLRSIQTLWERLGEGPHHAVEPLRGGV
ncbi:MAG: amidohydrolase [Thaumarchaeota archaeon]|nr:amidohydrolase [Candidatus Calditenuaceae archaeon]MDW8041195.1 amidohydrolase [Nitrososphaerota archaeon]